MEGESSNLVVTQGFFPGTPSIQSQRLPDLLASFGRLVYGALVKRTLEALRFTGRFVELELQYTTDKVPDTRRDQEFHWELIK